MKPTEFKEPMANVKVSEDTPIYWCDSVYATVSKFGAVLTFAQNDVRTDVEQEKMQTVVAQIGFNHEHLLHLNKIIQQRLVEYKALVEVKND